MNWFYATKDKTQAGPVDEATLADLLRAGTITQDTLIWKEGMDNWKPYSAVLGLPATAAASAPLAASGTTVCAECGQSFPPDQLIPLAGRSVCSSCKPLAVQKLQEGVVAFGETSDPEDLWQKIQARGYSCDVMSILSRSWALLTGNFWPCVGVTLLGYLVLMAANSIPFVNYLGMFLVQPQMMAGLNYYFLKQFRGEPATLNDSFAGFRFGYGRQALYMLIIFAIMMGIFVIIGVLAAITIPLLSQGGKPSEAAVIVMVLAAIPFALAIWYFILCWIFTPLLILDKGLRVLPAMKLSRRVVHLQFWKIVLLFLFFIVLGLAGFVTLCFGFLVALPLCFAMISRLYEDAFGTTTRPA
jgi:hypothetical protein